MGLERLSTHSCVDSWEKNFFFKIVASDRNGKSIIILGKTMVGHLTFFNRYSLVLLCVVVLFFFVFYFETLTLQEKAAAAEGENEGEAKAEGEAAAAKAEAVAEEEEEEEEKALDIVE